jgi:hypothetical protein
VSVGRTGVHAWTLPTWTATPYPISDVDRSVTIFDEIEREHWRAGHRGAGDRTTPRTCIARVEHASLVPRRVACIEMDAADQTGISAHDQDRE